MQQIRSFVYKIIFVNKRFMLFNKNQVKCNIVRTKIRKIGERLYIEIPNPVTKLYELRNDMNLTMTRPIA